MVYGASSLAVSITEHVDETERPTTLDRQLTALFRTHAAFVWRSMLRLGVPEASADDAVQEVFLVVSRRLADYEDRGSIRSWLFAIARRVASHHHRAASRRERRIEQVDLATAPEDPEQVMARKQAVAIVERFLDGLDEHRRMVFYLADVEGLSAPEISAALGVKLNTVYSRLRAARRTFERMLVETSTGEEDRGHGTTE